ncbi:GYDIA family GHMP kinase [Halpernia sp.]|uniref:GYDIA family GHMP kinase n=1 Tax=Halpernia sp. TaxID=2782209 RepID=UPI003A910DD1
MISQTYFSPGKLLITSEYFVLDGALAFAVPTFLGQKMEVSEISDSKNLIIWNAFHENKEWLNIKIDYKNWQILEGNIPDSAVFILNVFKNIRELNPDKFSTDSSYYFKTNLQFPSNFGLGSSSTLMNNLAKWAEINPFVLNEKSLGGSGYDIAIAAQNHAILFQNSDGKNNVETINFNPPFLDELVLIHLNQKQNSREGIELYKSKERSQSLINYFSELTEYIIKSSDIEEFSTFIEKHEIGVSHFLGLKTVKNLHFSDCPVFIKSLGAWGGDFVLSRKFPNYKNYFANKNYFTVFDWKEIVKTF